jgi:hypothetical protein
MTDTPPYVTNIESIISDYIDRVRKELVTRIDSWTPSVPLIQVQEVLGGLMARQITLATQLAQAPSTWNGHLAPIVLRAMTDVYITFAWIWGDPPNRAAMYVSYGRGQLKLHLEHLRAQLASRGEDPDEHPLVKAHQQAIDAEYLGVFTEVNVGSWSGTDTRSMAEEADCLDLYKFAYSPFSRATHSMWPHIAQYNLKPCVNPLHRMHRVPTDEDWPLDAHYFYLVAKYAQKTMRLFDLKTERRSSGQSAFGWLATQLTAPEVGPEDDLFRKDTPPGRSTPT